MITAFERVVYELALGARLAWYGGQSALTGRLMDPVPAPPELRGRMPSADALLADRLRLIDRERRNLEAGYYRLPRDLIENPLIGLRQTLRYFADLEAVNRRRQAGPPPALDTPESRRYPDYYRRAYHHQTDGYLSRHSAELYDHQVEVLFGGAGDVMRRQALVPLYRFVAAGRRIADLGLIDIACGTGRFLAQVKDNYPRLAVTALEISPYYLAEARRRLRHWSRVGFVEAAVESAQLPSEAFDIATCIFLFHELPGELHRTAAAGIARLLKPDGILVFVDSLQPGDVPRYDALLQYFPVAFHEPYFADYLTQDLVQVFAEAGLRPAGTEFAYLSRIMVFEKPGRGRRRATTPTAHAARISHSTVCRRIRTSRTERELGG